MATLKEMIASDLKTVFFANANEFDDEIEISFNDKQKYTVFASKQANTVDNANFGNASPLQGFSHTLYCEYPIGGEMEVEPGQVIYLDKEPFTVVDINEEMGAATIFIKAGRAFAR
jgi:hypothetical protein